jgi:nucleotide-binding universal stress UspA family protein
VPLDGSAGSQTALAGAVRWARAEHAAVRLLYVASGDTPEPGGSEAAAARLRAGDAIRGYLVGVAGGLFGLEVELAVRFGDPAEEILREADRVGVSLIAMATHRRAEPARRLAESVADRVVQAARVPVLLVEHGEPLSA